MHFEWQKHHQHVGGISGKWTLKCMFFVTYIITYIEIQDTSYAASVEGTFCLHINKLFFRLLSWLGRNDTNILNSSDTSKVGCHHDLTLPFLFQNETVCSRFFSIYLFQRWLTQKSFCPLSPVTHCTNCCSQQWSSVLTHQPCVPQIWQLILKALVFILCHLSYSLEPSFPRHGPVRVVPFLHVPVHSNFALISSGHGTRPVSGCEDSSDLCSCIEIPCTLKPG